MRLILFDIDGTLLECGPQVRMIMSATIKEIFGTTGSIDWFDFAGRTDPGIVLDVLKDAGLEEQDIVSRIPELKEKYAVRLEKELDRQRMRLLPGVADLMESLGRRKDIVLGLVTGNWEPGARTKLSRFDLNRYFDFGAFGCDAVDRSDLPPVALERAERVSGRRFRPEETLIVGDTIHDISCARAHGIPVVAVATGRTSAEILRERGADRVVADLTEITEW